MKVGQTDNYALYYVDQERLQADLYHTYNSDWNTATVITGVEDVMVQGNGRRTAVSALRKRQVRSFR